KIPPLPCDDSDFSSSPPPPHAATWGGTGSVRTTTLPTFHSTPPPPRSAAVHAGKSHERYSDHAFAAGGTLSGSGSVGLLICSVIALARVDL
ncbi:ZWICHEL kinesin-like calmodulin-binding protein, partial [Prunus dulcis]